MISPNFISDKMFTKEDIECGVLYFRIQFLQLIAAVGDKDVILKLLSFNILDFLHYVADLNEKEEMWVILYF